MGKVQYLDWGRIEWIYEPEAGSADHLRVGISVMNGYAVQPSHLHYGDEQFMYILSGYGRQKINGEESVIEPGEFFHVSPGMAHESQNDGEEPIVKLLVSISAVISPVRVARDQREKILQMERIDKKEFLRETIKELLRHNLKPFRIPLTIFDENHDLIYNNMEFPHVCRDCCHIQEDIYNCELYSRKMSCVSPYYERAASFSCPRGLFLYNLPIVFDGDLLGFIKTGHIRVRTEEDSLDAENDVYSAPLSTVNGMLDTVHNIVESICAHYQFCLVQVNLHKNKRELSDKIKEGGKIQEYLETAQNQVLNLQINQHFLFNTLNTISGMAIREEAFGTYSAIGDLAQLFRYTLRSEGSFALLKEEIGYVKNYTNLQKLRFGDRLEVVFELEEGLLENCEVPFNFLQPVVENCFIHGFKNMKSGMRMCIRVYRKKTHLFFEVQDNGEGMSEETKEELHREILEGTRTNGLFMVVRKLRFAFGDDFSCLFQTPESGGTLVCIKIPAAAAKGEANEKNIVG